MISIFPTIIHDIDIPNFKKIEKDLIKFVYQEKKKDPVGVNNSNVGGWQSKELGLDNILSETIIESVEKYFTASPKILRESMKLSSVRPWININKKGDSNSMHTHPGCDYAGVFWIKSSKGCGDLEFHSPSHHSQYNECMSYTEIFQKESGCFPSASISPVPGKIFIFPASLYHQVQTSHSNEDRISSSFNITIYY